MEDNIEFQLSQLLDGDLSPEEEARLLARLRDDEELSRTYAGYRRLDEMLEDLAVAPELSEVDYDTQRSDIMASLAKKALLTQRPRTRVLPWVFGGAMAAAAAAALVLGAMTFFKTAFVPTAVPTTGGPAGSVASMIVPPSKNLGTVESALEPLARDAGEYDIAIVQARVNDLDDDEFMLSDPEDNPLLAHRGEIGRDTKINPLPAGTVLMVLDRPVERDFDWFDVF